MADNNFPLTTAQGGTVNAPAVTGQPSMEGAAEAAAAPAAAAAGAEFHVHPAPDQLQDHRPGAADGLACSGAYG